MFAYAFRMVSGSLLRFVYKIGCVSLSKLAVENVDAMDTVDIESDFADEELYQVETPEQALGVVVASLDGGGEDRSGQREMCNAVADAMNSRRHLIVSAGTGTGKSLAYLTPLLFRDSRTVVVTATKTLQDQLVSKDLPQLVSALDYPVKFAVLKGRSNYLCVQRLNEYFEDKQENLDLDGGLLKEDLAKLVDWSETTETGDRAELDFEPSSSSWNLLSVSGRECPGGSQCPSGKVCFAEKARDKAAASDVVVVNTHLYCLDLFSKVAFLPDHDTVVIDEAHVFEDIASDTAGLSITGGQFDSLAHAVRQVVEESESAENLVSAGKKYREVLAGYKDKQLPDPLPSDLQELSSLVWDAVKDARTEVMNVPEFVGARRERALLLLGSSLEDLLRVMELDSSEVSWVSGTERSPVWRTAPIELGGLLTQKLWGLKTAVLASATIPSNMGQLLGLDGSEHDEVDVGSPFDYKSNGLLYCPRALPAPKDNGYESALHDEIEVLMNAAGGRTLALFTSYKAMNAAADTLRRRTTHKILVQGDLPQQELLSRFSKELDTCLFATMSMWQGVDVPGESLSLVIIDKLPFPRPDDPLLQARRERWGSKAFRLVDLPRASTKLAQGAGRLVRSGADKGVVAVLDSRLANANYRKTFLRTLPPFLRVTDRERVVDFLRDLRKSDQVEEPF